MVQKPFKNGWKLMDWIQFLVQVLILLSTLAILAIMVALVVRLEQLEKRAGNCKTLLTNLSS